MWRARAAIHLAALMGLASPADAAAAPAPDGAAMQPTRLRCEYAVNPVGVEAGQPLLSWELASALPAQRQSAYQVLVASSPARLGADQGDVWDSGRVNSAASTHVKFLGRSLRPRQRCWWKVRVWDDAGRVSHWSPPAHWEMALLQPADWRAQWIGSGPAQEPRPPEGFFMSVNTHTNLVRQVRVDGRSTLLRRTFVVRKPLARAEVYVTGLGYYELHCNGRRVGDQVLTPAKSNYRRWVYYDIYDVTTQLRSGTNALGIQLGNGWFNPEKKWWEPYRMQWFGAKRAWLQLHLDYADGTSELIVTDGSWKTAPGPILSSCVFDGEVYDATQERPGWDQPAFDDSGWPAARVVEPPGGRLVAQLMPPIRVVEHLKPLTVKQPQPGVFVFDLGQNFSGWARLLAAGPRGTRVTLRYAEDLRRDGMIDTTSNERALATDVYVMKGKGRETYEPRFTFHGFRYVEVTGFPGVPQLENLLGCVVHTDAESVGEFACGNELINRIHRATRWSQRSNLMGYPMDCPQRDERLGWFGDAMVSMEEAQFNFDLPLFYRQWLNGVQLNQNPVNGDISIVSPRPYLPDEPDPNWSSGYLVMLWQYYRHYGDTNFLAQHFDSMRRYVDYLGTQATDHILPQYWIGDWGTTLAGWQEGEPVSAVTAFYYLDAVIVARTAQVLGRRADAAQYQALAEEIRRAFNRRYFDRARRQYERGTQFSNAFPLAIGLVDAADQTAVLNHIVQDLKNHHDHFNVGVLGAKYLLDALTDGGRADLAFQLATQTGFPSWAHLLEGGRTTLSEFWDLKGSHNHVMLGSVDGWFYRVLGGIQSDPAHPGFERIIIKPHLPKTLSFARASTRTVRGRVAVDWEQRPDALQLRVSIPVNSHATVYVPVSAAGSVTSIPPLPPSRTEDQAVVYEVGSGLYEFRAVAAQ